METKMHYLTPLKILVIIYVSNSPLVADSSCPTTDKKGCVCDSSIQGIIYSPGWQIICSNGVMMLYSIQLSPNKVELDCFSEVPYEPNIYQRYHIEVTNYVFSSCPLPNTTVASLLKSSNITSLEFTCGGCWQTGIVDPAIFADLTRLKTLTLSHFQFQKLPANLFANMPNLETISMESDRIEELPADIFANLSHLLSLDLGFNNVTLIPVQLFDGLTNLKDLHLNDNKLEYLDPKILKSLGSLETLNLKNNKITRLAPYTFAANVLISDLNFGGNALTTLGANSFSGMNNVTYIDIGNNRNLSSIDESAFGEIPTLTNLKFSSCQVTIWPEKVFQGLPNLASLDISNNSVLSLPENLFRRNEQLNTLVLDNNNLTFFPNKLFDKQINLESLSIVENNFEIIPSKSFVNLVKLKTLNMKNNFIRSVEAGDLDALMGLETLILSGNKISSIPRYISFGEGSARLRDVNLSHNQLTELTDVNWNVYLVLENLDFSYNQITNVKIPILFSEGTQIDLTHNLIAHVNCDDISQRDDALANNVLNIDLNILEKYRTSKFRLSSNPYDCDCNLLNFKLLITSPNYSYRRTMILDAPNMKCSSPENQTLLNLLDVEFVCPVEKDCPSKCRCYFTASGNVTTVDCSNTDSTALPETLPFNTTVVFFNNNLLKTLSGTDNPSYQKVIELRVDNNLLTSQDWTLPASLKLLSLRGNQLTLIPQTLSINNGLKLYLGSNPWACNCSAQSITDLVKFQSESIGDYFNITCYTPANLQGRSMTNVSDSDICPPHLVNQIVLKVLSTVTALIVVTAFAICVLYYRNKQTVVAYLYIHYFKIYSIFFKEEFDEDKYYHAFVSYSSLDRDVALSLIEELENKEPKFKLCIHERDWQPGNLIAFNIAHSVQNSRRTIIVLSEDFLKSVWFQMEFHIAYYQMLEDKIDRLIVVVKGNLPEKDKLDKDLQILLTTKTYLEWGEKWFWEKLKYALPHRKILKSRVENPQIPNTALIRKIEDKIVSLTAETVQTKTTAEIEQESNNPNSRRNHENSQLNHENNNQNCQLNHENNNQNSPTNHENDNLQDYKNCLTLKSIENNDNADVNESSI